MIENPYVPHGIDPNPYWGDFSSLPPDREFSSNRVISVTDEVDQLDDGYLDWKKRLKEFMKLNELIKWRFQRKC
jgi:hypothetical protein